MQLPISHLTYSSTVIMVAKFYPESSLDFQLTTWHYIPEDRTLCGLGLVSVLDPFALVVRNPMSNFVHHYHLSPLCPSISTLCPKNNGGFSEVSVCKYTKGVNSLLSHSLTPQLCTVSLSFLEIAVIERSHSLNYRVLHPVALNINCK
jgi:hypothetical protein